MSWTSWMRELSPLSSDFFFSSSDFSKAKTNTFNKNKGNFFDQIKPRWAKTNYFRPFVSDPSNYTHFHTAPPHFASCTSLHYGKPQEAKYGGAGSSSLTFVMASLVNLQFHGPTHKIVPI